MRLCLLSLQRLPMGDGCGEHPFELVRWVLGNITRMTEGEPKQTGSSSSPETEVLVSDFLEIRRNALGLPPNWVKTHHDIR